MFFESRDESARRCHAERWENCAVWVCRVSTIQERFKSLHRGGLKAKNAAEALFQAGVVALVVSVGPQGKVCIVRLQVCISSVICASVIDRSLPTDCPAEIGENTNPVLLYLTTGPEPAWTRRPCWEGRPGHSAMKPRLRNMESWRKQPLPTLKWTCRMCEAEFPNVETLDPRTDLLHGQYRFYST